MLITADRTRRTAATTVRDVKGGGRAALLSPAAAAILGVALGVLVVRDGSLGWQFARGLVTVALSAATAIVLLRRRGWPAGVLAIGLGVAATATGAGVGLPHLAKEAPPVPIVAGLVALLAGLIVLVAGVRTVLRSVGGWRRVPLLVAVTILVVPVIYSFTVAVAVTNVPRTSLGEEDPADRGLVYRDVDFPATDGVLLSGWYVPGHNRAAVVLLHGAGSTRSAVLDHAAVLAEHGYGVLLFDARGHGRSDGRAMDFGWFGDEDIGGAVSFLTAQPGVDVLAAMGMSMGGEEAIGAAAADDRIAAVVAEGATNRVAGDKAWLPDEHGIRGWLQRPVDWLTYTAADVLTEAGAPTTLRAAAAGTSSPVLLITAGDQPDELGAARYIASGSPATVEIWNVPDTSHTDALRTHPVEWESRVTEFLGRTLLRS